MEQEKIKQIQERIKNFKVTHPVSSKSVREQKIDPLTIALDLVASVMMGFFVGLGLDKFFDTKPCCIIIFSVIGILAGFKIIWQRLNSKNNVT